MTAHTRPLPASDRSKESHLHRSLLRIRALSSIHGCAQDQKEKRKTREMRLERNEARSVVFVVGSEL